MSGRTVFEEKLAAFIAAGHELVEAWDDGEGFNADEEYGAASHLFPLSVDEWLLELYAFYNVED
jgi:hypothetical protein